MTLRTQLRDELRDELRAVATLLREAERPVRVLRSVAWGRDVKERFLASGGTELPRIAYPPFDPAPVLAAIAQARRRIDRGAPGGAWLARQADAIERAAQLLAAIGTPGFLEHGVALYGSPTSPHSDGVSTSIELARTVDSVWSELHDLDLGAPPPACHLAEHVASEIRAAVVRHFGPDAPAVEVVDELSANALAGARSIRVRRSACFTDRDVAQLVQHEAFVHVCTSLNGLAQEHLPLLASGHPGTTSTQEGLAVFSELVTGAMDPDRFRRLAGRVLAIQMAIEGADFLEVYRFFLGRIGDPSQAFESARRVFRGGVLTGGAPFMKDVVYLHGLIRVSSFLHAVVAAGRADLLALLFCGKLDVEDVPDLAVLAAEGICAPPKHLPPWVADRRFLVAHLTFAQFQNRVDAAAVEAHYDALLAAAPRVTAFDATRAGR